MPDLFASEHIQPQDSPKSILTEKSVCFIGSFKQNNKIKSIKKDLRIKSIPSPSKRAQLIVIGENAKFEHLQHIRVLKHDGYCIHTINEEEFIELAGSECSELNLEIPVKKVEINYDYLFNSPVIEKIIRIEENAETHFLGAKEIYIQNTIGDIDALAQCLGNLGACVSYALSDDTDYIWLSKSCVENLQSGLKDSLILEVERFYNSSKSTKFNYQFLLEDNILNYIEKRATELDDEISLDLFERFKEKAYEKLEKSSQKKQYNFPPDKHYIKENGIYIFRLEDGRAWVPSRQMEP